MSERSVVYLVDRFPMLSETFIALEIAELRRRGWRVHVIAMHPGGPARATDVQYWDTWRPPSRPRYVLAHLRALGRPANYARYLRVAWALEDERRRVAWKRVPVLAQQLPPGAVLHSHFAWSGSALGAMLAAVTGRQWTMTVHARDIFADRRHLQLKLDRASRVVTVCRYNAEWLRSEEKYSGALDLVVCGVEMPQHPPGSSTRSRSIVAVGRLVEKKGFDLLVSAVADAKARGHDIDVRIIGDGPLRAALAEQVAVLGVEGQVTLMGSLTHAAVLQEMCAATALCLPARIARDGDRDSMPLVVKEAMVRSVPAIATRVVGIPEMVDDSVGWLVPPEDPHALASALIAAVSDPEEARRRGAAGRERVLQAFTLREEVGKLMRILEGSEET